MPQMKTVGKSLRRVTTVELSKVELTKAASAASLFPLLLTCIRVARHRAAGESLRRALGPCAADNVTQVELRL